MTEYLLEMFGLSLALTLVMEIAVGYGMGMRQKDQILLLVLVNILTNPAAVLLHWLGVPQIPIEIVVVLVESAIYCLFSGDRNWNIRHPIRLAVVCNAVSWMGGMLFQMMGG